MKTYKIPKVPKIAPQVFIKISPKTELLMGISVVIPREISFAFSSEYIIKISYSNTSRDSCNSNSFRIPSRTNYENFLRIPLQNLLHIFPKFIQKILNELLCYTVLIVSMEFIRRHCFSYCIFQRIDEEFR